MLHATTSLLMLLYESAAFSIRRVWTILQGGTTLKIRSSTHFQTQLEHILLRPDTYIGSVEPQTEYIWVLGDDGRMVQRNVTYVPGLYKIFDEILVNASDNKQRDPKNMTDLKVVINEEEGWVSVYNNGKMTFHCPSTSA